MGGIRMRRSVACRGCGAMAVLGASPACPADLDGDGVLTFFDFLAFQTLFDAGCP
ncbi:MAG: hypothetical protein KatS3mg103_1142 [Phycisphaerales bacterium]|nr:MAG: hypothetical protein KatS3mg103_1142 [Phycisphaerales bacterium]